MEEPHRCVGQPTHPAAGWCSDRGCVNCRSTPFPTRCRPAKSAVVTLRNSCVVGHCCCNLKCHAPLQRCTAFRSVLTGLFLEAVDIRESMRTVSVHADVSQQVVFHSGSIVHQCEGTPNAIAAMCGRTNCTHGLCCRARLLQIRVHPTCQY